jgi:hypothetical protein
VNELYHRTYLCVSILQCQSNNDSWWVCQVERIFLYPSYYLGQFHSKPYINTRMISHGMKVLAWYIDPNGTCTLLVSKNVKFSLYIPEWYQKKDNTSPTLVYTPDFSIEFKILPSQSVCSHWTINICLL